MLNGIKTLINSKIAMQESASVILENSSMMDLDDAIILGEEGDIGVPIEEEDTDNSAPTMDDDTDNSSQENDEDSDSGDANEPESVPGAEEPNSDTSDNDSGKDSIDDVDTSDPMNDNIGDSLPEPVGKQTGEPVVDDDTDLMNMDINIASNTMSNVLPVPPSNASDAVVDDEMSTSTDSGFEGIDTSDPMNDNIEKVPTAESTSFVEGISLAGGMEGDSQQTDSTGDPAPEDTTTNSSDTPPDTNNAENDVTSAVRDKVNESETTTDPAATDTTTDTGGISTENNGSTMSKEEIFKRLSRLTGDIEGLKEKLVVGK